jgi:hypothetical protein
MSIWGRDGILEGTNPGEGGVGGEVVSTSDRVNSADPASSAGPVCRPGPLLDRLTQLSTSHYPRNPRQQFRRITVLADNNAREERVQESP